MEVELDLKTTGKPELAEATSATGLPPVALLGSGAKVITWVDVLILNVRVIGVAGLKFELPACMAVIEQVPAATNETVVPLTVQMDVEPELKETGKPEDEVALMAIELAEYV